MVQRWLVTAVLSCSAACSDHETAAVTPAPSQTTLPCDPGTTPSIEWAQQAYQIETGKSTSRSALRLKDKHDGVVELTDETVAEETMGRKGDPPIGRYGLFWKCKRYESEQALVAAMLVAQGWGSADSKRRSELALALDHRLATSLTTPPEGWDPARTFSPPTVEPDKAGGIKLVRWIRHYAGPSSGHSYVRQSQLIDGKPTVHAPERLEGYQPRGAYADPQVLASCDPRKPPTVEWAYATYLERHKPPLPIKIDRVKLENLGEGVYLLVSADPEYSLSYVRRCQAGASRRDFVPAILTEKGWKSAKAVRRIELARNIDAFSEDIVAARPKDWQGPAFKKPTYAARPDGGVTMIRWVIGNDDAYQLREDVIDTNGAVTGKIVEQIEPKK